VNKIFVDNYKDI